MHFPELLFHGSNFIHNERLKILEKQIGNGHAQNRGCADGVNAIDHGADLHPGIFHSALGIVEVGKDAGENHKGGIAVHHDFLFTRL